MTFDFIQNYRKFIEIKFLRQFMTFDFIRNYRKIVEINF